MSREGYGRDRSPTLPREGAGGGPPRPDPSKPTLPTLSILLLPQPILGSFLRAGGTPPNCAANHRAAAGADPAPHPVGGRDPPSRLGAPERGLSKPTQRGRGEISADRRSRAYPGFPEPRRLLPWTSTTLPGVPFIAFNMTRPLFTTGVGVSCPGSGQLRRPRPRSSFWPFCWAPLARPAAAPSAWWAPPSGRLARVRRPLPVEPDAAPGRGPPKNLFR